MHTSLSILIGKTIRLISRLLNVGSGSTWPGHVALSINKDFIKNILKQNTHLKIILIAGTNGKTTTGKLIQTILEKAKYRVFQNESGANLLNGIASSMLLHSGILCALNYDYAILEVDEATLPLALKEITPDYLVIINLFRDQLDRYGEVNAIAHKWKEALGKLTSKTQLILNADDPQIAYLIRHSGKRRGVPDGTPRSASRIANGNKRCWTSQNDEKDITLQTNSKIFYFGLKDKKFAQKEHQHAVDSTYCPSCSSKFAYNITYYSHLGDWECKECGYKRPENIYATTLPSKLIGTYNLYNILAATLVSKKIGISDEIIKRSLRTFSPAFGRQEMLNVAGKKVQIFLSKNPTSFNESLKTIENLGAKNVLLVLNDRIPDGRDVSWIWDVDFEDYVDQFKSIIISGDRCYDMGLRMKYAIQNSTHSTSSELMLSEVEASNLKFQIAPNLKNAIRNALELTSHKDTLYILPTYSAMLEVRKILTGKKIL